MDIASLPHEALIGNFDKDISYLAQGLPCDLHRFEEAKEVDGPVLPGSLPDYCAFYDFDNVHCALCHLMPAPNPIP